MDLDIKRIKKAVMRNREDTPDNLELTAACLIFSKDLHKNSKIFDYFIRKTRALREYQGRR